MFQLRSQLRLAFANPVMTVMMRSITASASPVKAYIGSQIPEDLQYRLSYRHFFNVGEVVVLDKGAGKHVFAKVQSLEGTNMYTGQSEYELSIDGGLTMIKQPSNSIGKIYDTIGRGGLIEPSQPHLQRRYNQMQAAAVASSPARSITTAVESHLDPVIGSKIPKAQYLLSYQHSFDVGDVVVLKKGTGKYIFGKVRSLGRTNLSTGEVEYQVAIDGASAVIHQPAHSLGKICAV
eukprot:CAMPEP_0113687692 /NCGR_PEP_ID=MMETSP0038_2-20120614/16089_1 /TAXON_ID=2898 /ORGANISM="Cryptomonas paramecium" /LENGTH=234 /DNA_ID=CAMNT_0000608359 /DNA_START=67 /DNA_END=772 /DNA_ORIENTATION=+ /assembly_acc=CAM_ASM_000170